MRPAIDVLVVEDEAVVVESVKRILAPEGFTVHAAGSSEEATQRLQTGSYDLILVDIVLPGISGLQFIELLGKRHPQAITLTISGLTTRENVIESFRCGAFDFIPKPFSFEELLGPVQRAVVHLRSREAGPAGEHPAAGAAEKPPLDAWGGYRFFGRHIWAKSEQDGSVVIGVDASFDGVLGDLEAVEFPGAFEEILQGHVCVRMTTKGKSVHLVWCPMSGVVVESNAGIATGRAEAVGPGVPYNGTWLVRVWPQALEEESVNLKSYEQL